MKIAAIVIAAIVAGVVVYVFVFSNTAPVAGFTYKSVDLHLTVTATGSTDPDRDPLSFAWDWGDKKPVGTGFQVGHDYDSPGTYNVTLTVSDGRGLSANAMKSISVVILPTAFFLARTTQMTVSVDGSGSSGSTGAQVTSYNWSWGDGLMDAGVRATHTYATPGRHNVTLNITDSSGKTGTASRYVSPASTTVDILYDQFFSANCPYRDYWPLRYRTYGDILLLKSQTPCVDYYPWVLWNSPLYSALTPSWLYTLYHFDALVRNHKGYSVYQPVVLPVFNYSVQPAGNSFIEFNWSFNYLGQTGLNYWSNTTYGVGTGYSDGFGYLVRGNVTMDLQESKRIFGEGDPVVFSPTANSTSTWKNAGNGFAPDTLYTTSQVNNSIAEYKNYSIPQLAASPIQKVEVGLEGHETGDDEVRLEFSTDGGVNWQAAGTVTPGATDSTTFFDVTSLRSWTTDLLNNTNFRTRIVYVQVGGTSSPIYVNWIPIRVQSTSSSWWWAASTRPGHSAGPLETRYASWLQSLGDGKYDIYNGFQYYYSTDVTDLNATVDPTTGVTQVHFFLDGWGYDVLMARWFYWGNASYQQAVCVKGYNTAFANCDATLPYGAIQPAGWMPQETCWCEASTIDGNITNHLDLDFSGVSEYQFEAWANAGPDGFYNTTDDGPEWAWGPTLMDYVPGATSGSPAASTYPNSELRWYQGISTLWLSPGSYSYNQPYEYMVVPSRWNFTTGNTLTLVLPRTPVPWFRPYESRWNPSTPPIRKLNDYSLFNATLTLRSVSPLGAYYLWDERGKVLSFAGPWDWGTTSLPVSSYPFVEFVQG